MSAVHAQEVKNQRRDYPKAILLSVVIILFMPAVSSSLWILTALTAQVDLIMYLLMLAAAIRPRYLRPDVKRAYRIPGGDFGIWCVAGLGVLASLFAIIVGVFPPAQLAEGSALFYESFLVPRLPILAAPPPPDIPVPPRLLSPCRRAARKNAYVRPRHGPNPESLETEF